MLTSGNVIRLTPKELDDYRKTTGAQQAPKTREEYNRAIRNAAAQWEAIGQQENCAEAKFLAAIVGDEVI